MSGPAWVRRSAVDFEWARERGVQTVLLVTFAAVSFLRLAGAVRLDTIGIDARIYRLAAEAALTGGDPWAARDVFLFAGTPPSLVPFVPLVLVAPTVAVVVGIAVCGAVGWWIVRRLGLAPWWLLFPPLFESISTVNEDVFVVAFLLLPGAVAGLAAVAKTYALVPLLLQRRWLAVGVGIVASAALAPLWLAWWERREAITQVLVEQADGGLSAWGAWPVFVLTVVALWGLRHHGASWLVIPALWPASQLHYAVVALPVAKKSPLVAFLLCFANPLLPPIAVILECVRIRVVPWAIEWWAGRTATAR